MTNKIKSILLHNPIALLAWVIFKASIIILILIILGYKYTENKIIITLLPPTITALAILISAYCASLLASENIKSARLLASKNIKKSRKNIKLQETLKYIVNAELDEEWIKSKSIWNEYKSQEDHDRAFKILFSWYYLWGGDQEKKNKICKKIVIKNKKYKCLNHKIVNEHAQYVMTYFNYFEFISLGIESGIIDEEFYKNWHGTHFIRAWNYSVTGIGAIRTALSNDRLFNNWQNIVERWGPTLNRQSLPVPDCSIGDLIATLEKQTKENKINKKNKTS